MIQMVLELNVADYPSDQPSFYDAYQFERHEREQIEQLNPGSYVRLNVGRYGPLNKREFFRPDLIWQIIARDVRTLNQWREHLEGVPVAEY